MCLYVPVSCKLYCSMAMYVNFICVHEYAVVSIVNGSHRNKLWKTFIMFLSSYVVAKYYGSEFVPEMSVV